MIREKKKILAHRIIWLSILILCIVVPIIISQTNVDGFYGSTFMLCIYIDIIIFVLFIKALLLSCKEYEYNGNIIVVYAGFYHHYISVNGIKVDEHNTLTTWTPIKLSSKLDDGTQLNAVISLTNRVSLKINDKLYNKR